MITWLDLETTGLNPDHCSIIEVALKITDDKLVPVSGMTMVVRPKVHLWEPEAFEMHRASGLYDEAMQSTTSADDAAQRLIAYMMGLGAQYPQVREPMPLAGSTIAFDRAFLTKHWPEVHRLFHYRSIDVSGFKEMVSRTFGIDREGLPPLKADSQHRAAADVDASLLAMRWYRDNCLVQPEAVFTHEKVASR